MITIGRRYHHIGSESYRARSARGEQQAPADEEQPDGHQPELAGEDAHHDEQEEKGPDATHASTVPGVGEAEVKVRSRVS
jgi:hypothetical protein